MTKRFRNRIEAGQLLAAQLLEYADRPDVLVLGLPRGGIPIAFEVAKVLHAPLDICLVRKLGVPGHKELAMGAIAPGGIRVLNQELVTVLGIARDKIEAVTAQELQELDRRDRLYRGDRPLPPIQGRIIILVDDGIATGSTMRAAIATLRQQQPQAIVVAVPVAPASIEDEFKPEVDRIVSLKTPEPFYAIGLWYDDFSQTTDAEVRDLLARQFSIR
ncbi:MAG: phosphoribosyltransferase [Leptolyngbyaceae bacterium]|nr:phosphoribosyltransferase [Leptolyngbyaceae bacterium]